MIDVRQHVAYSCFGATLFSLAASISEKIAAAIGTREHVVPAAIGNAAQRSLSGRVVSGFHRGQQDMRCKMALLRGKAVGV